MAIRDAMGIELIRIHVEDQESQAWEFHTLPQPHTRAAGMRPRL